MGNPVNPVYRSRQWARVRRKVLHRDRFECQIRLPGLSRPGPCRRSHRPARVRWRPLRRAEPPRIVCQLQHLDRVIEYGSARKRQPTRRQW